MVLTTRDPADAIRAFAEQVVDCFLKPADAARCRLALTRAQQHIHQAEAVALSRRAMVALAKSATAPPPEERYLTRLSVPVGTRSVIIQSAAIEWVGAEDCYSRVHSDEGSFLIRQTLGALERRLDPNAFLRPHRSAVVNVERVQELRRGADGGTVLVLRSGVEIPVSQRRQQIVRQRVAGSLANVVHCTREALPATS
jgi:two-component system LytT family response regulator